MIEHTSNIETPEPEGDHIPPGTPTQVAHPWRATLRTVAQTGVDPEIINKEAQA